MIMSNARRALALILTLTMTLLPVLTLASKDVPSNWFELIVYSIEQGKLPDMTPFTALDELTISTENLKGIESMSNLRHLTLRSNGADLTPLAALPNLEALDLSLYGASVDLDILAKLPHLTELRLPEEAYGQVPTVLSMPSLAFMPDLVSLSINAPQKENETDEEPFDWTLLASLPKLQRLRIVDLGAYQTKAQADAVLKIVADLSALKELTLENCDPNLDFTPLNALTGLDVLAFRQFNNDVGDLSGLLKVPGWTELALYCESEVSMAPLIKLPRLEKLAWKHDYYADSDEDVGYKGDPPDMSPLAEMSGLLSLELEFQAYGPDLAVDLSSLDKMPILRELTLSGCKVDFLASMPLTQLEMLNIYNPVYYAAASTDTYIGFDTKLLAAVPNLRELTLSCNPDTDLSQLTKLTKLERLYVNGILPKDFNPLLDMKQLRYVSLYIESDFIEPLEDLWLMLHQALPGCEIVMTSGLDY